MSAESFILAHQLYIPANVLHLCDLYLNPLLHHAVFSSVYTGHLLAI